MIPEFVGRVPVVTAMDLLDEKSLVRILSEPKNALAKQYRKLFELDGVELEFTQEALEVIAKRSFERKTGARGLRAIIEAVMMDSMFTVPTDTDVVKCIVTKEAAEGTAQPQMIRAEGGQVKKAAAKKAVHRNEDEIA